MSRVEELLAKYNPNGVEFDEIGKNVQSLPKEILKNEFVQLQGQYPVINSGRDIQGFYSRYNNDGDVFTIASRGESAGFIQYSAIPFWAGGLCYPYRTNDNNKVSTKFLYYYLKKTEKSIMTNMVLRGGIPAINKSDFEKYKIPLPHIKVQEEIVKILDSFTNLIDALNEELSLRQKQFEYYREKLLTFDDSVKRIKLEDIGYFYGGLSGKTKNDFIEGNKKFVSYMNVFTNSTICLDINDKVKISDGETQNKIAYGDILFTGSSETPNECGMSSVVTTDIDEEIYLNSFCFGYRFYNLDGISPKFFSFLMRSTLLRNEISKTANGVTRFNVSKKLLAKVNVFIPSLKVQQSIVSKLDAFESLISSLKEEIALRQKQYEYYREKLLTFE